MPASRGRAVHPLPIVIALVTMGLPSTAFANGRFPGATQLVLRGDRGVMTSSFGLVTTTDRFATPNWSCERSFGYYRR